MNRPAYIRRKPKNPEVRPYIVDSIEPHTRVDLVNVIFEGDGNILLEYRTKVDRFHVGKGTVYLRGCYYTPEEWDELYVRVDDGCHAEEQMKVCSFVTENKRLIDERYDALGAKNVYKAHKMNIMDNTQSHQYWEIANALYVLH